MPGVGSLARLHGSIAKRSFKSRNACCLPLRGVKDLLDPIGTEYHSDPIVVMHCRKSEQCDQFVDRVPLRSSRCGNPAGSRDIDDEPGRPVHVPRHSV